MWRGTIIMERTNLHGRQVIQERMGGFSRRSRRERVSGFTCDIADGYRLLNGRVENISANGFKMTQLSEAFLGDEHCYRTVVAGGGKHFKILAKPCWKRSSPEGLEVGFKIIDVSWEWTELLLTTELERLDEDWAAGNA